MKAFFPLFPSGIPPLVVHFERVKARCPPLSFFPAPDGMIFLTVLF